MSATASIPDPSPGQSTASLYGDKSETDRTKSQGDAGHLPACAGNLWEGLQAVSKHLDAPVVSSLVCRDANSLMAHTSFFHSYLVGLEKGLDSNQTSNFLMQPLPSAEKLKHEIEHHPFASQAKTQAENKHRLLKGLVRHIQHMPKECKLEELQQQFKNHFLLFDEENNLARLEEAELKTLQAVFPEPNGDERNTPAQAMGVQIADIIQKKRNYFEQFAEGKIKKLDVPEHFRDKNFYRLVVSIKGCDLQSVPDAMLDETIITIAVKQDGNALQFTPEDKRTEALCLAALQNGGYPLWFVPAHFKQSSRFLLKAYDQNPDITQEMDDLTRVLLNGALAAQATQKAGQSALNWLKGITKK